MKRILSHLRLFVGLVLQNPWQFFFTAIAMLFLWGTTERWQTMRFVIGVVFILLSLIAFHNSMRELEEIRKAEGLRKGSKVLTRVIVAVHVIFWGSLIAFAIVALLGYREELSMNVTYFYTAIIVFPLLLMAAHSSGTQNKEGSDE